MDKDGLTLAEANARAWNIGFELLNRSIERKEDFSFETTLGGNSITQALLRAAASGMDVFVFYVGLDSPDRHIARVTARVIRAGHPIAAHTIRERYPRSLANLIRLLPCAREVRIYDHSDESADGTPRAHLVLSMSHGRIVQPSVDELVQTVPEWAKSAQRPQSGFTSSGVRRGATDRRRQPSSDLGIGDGRRRFAIAAPSTGRSADRPSFRRSAAP